MKVSLLLLVLSLLSAPAFSQASMFADTRASRVGDVVTVVLVEQTSAQRESQFSNRNATQFGGSGGASTSTGAFSVNAQMAGQADSRNQSSQRDLLTGTVTARIVEVMEGGTLRISGTRELSVNGVRHVMQIEGLVRPFDIRGDNSVLSIQVADARIDYHKEGAGRIWRRPMFWSTLGAILVTAASFVLVN